MPTSRQLHGYSYEKVSLLGMPHIGAAYDLGSYRTTGSYHSTGMRCAICGAMANNCHHVVPRRVLKTFELETPKGDFLLRSPLHLLCGTGVSGHHGAYHSGILKARWVWDTEENERMWWDGTFLSQMPPHSPELFRHGHYEVEDLRRGVTIRLGSAQSRF